MRDTLQLLRLLNEELLDRRWTDEDLRDLVTPRFGVVSSFGNISRDLRKILERDLGDTPPDVRIGEPRT